MSDNAASQPGLFGKVPTHGDFVSRRLPASFVERWDHWLQEAISDSRDQLGDNWLDIYLTSPIWRFVLSPGVVDQSAWAGLLMPSVDRVGRYFPLTLAAPLQASESTLRVIKDEDEWFNTAETLLLSCLEDGFDLESFDQRLAGLGAPKSVVSVEHGLAVPVASEAPISGAWRIAVPGRPQIDSAYPQLLDQTLAELFFAYSLWSTDGSDYVSPSLLACQGLPPIQGYTAMLAGDWQGRGWQES